MHISAEDGHDVVLQLVGGGGDAVIASVDDEGHLVGPGGLEDGRHGLEGLVLALLGDHVYLRHHHKERHLGWRNDVVSNNARCS